MGHTVYDFNFDHNFVKQANINWISVSQHNFDKPADLNQLDTFFRRSYTLTGIIVKTDCHLFEEIMIKASENKRLGSNYKWLIINDDRDGLTSNSMDENVFSKLNLSINADVTIARREGSDFKLEEVYNFGKIQGGRVVRNEIGFWSLENGLFMRRGYKYLRRFYFEGIHLRLMIVYQGIPEEFKPEIILERELATGISIVTQASGMILNEVASIHNIKFKYSICDRWVGDYKRESPYAVTNALHFGDIDITPILRFLPYHFEYYDVIHQPVTHVEARYFYRIPTTGVGKFENQFLTPFTTGVWWCVVAVVSLCGLGLLLSAMLEQRPLALHYAFFSVVALTCQQFFEDVNEGAVKRNSTARKLTVLVTGVSCVLIFNYYTSSVVSWLLNGPPPSINSLWELMDSSLEPIFEDVGYTRSWLQLPDYYYNKKTVDAEDALKKKIKKRGKIVLTSPAEGVEMVRTGAYAFHCETNSANKYIAKTFTPKELCDLDSLPSIDKTPLHTAVQKNSPYREFFVWSYARITEQGIINLVHSRTNSRDMKCEGSSPRALALGGASPAFLLLALGYLLGTIIMLFER
ncbi:ionotropic receptor 75a-like [Zerene cesonia]|uniref:ionotropic receptor 75a-like n=1 Tax=Zerene cesonia TaxID=33412 RepID=UPI0018E57C06|nr:ionotropic receptor 75a-like [Zerene cesonia]